MNTRWGSLDLLKSLAENQSRFFFVFDDDEKNHSDDDGGDDNDHNGGDDYDDDGGGDADYDYDGDDDDDDDDDDPAPSTACGRDSLLACLSHSILCPLSSNFHIYEIYFFSFSIFSCPGSSIPDLGE